MNYARITGMAGKAKPKIDKKIPDNHYTIDYFWVRVDKSPGFGPNGDCWEWTGGFDSSNYGIIHLRCFIKTISAHKFSYSLLKNNGNIVQYPTQILHRCDNSRCVNPGHMFLGTQADNVRDMVSKRRHYHPIGSLNPKVKLTEDNVKDIRGKFRETPIDELASKFNVGKGTIRNVLNNQTWKHLL